MRNQTNLDEKRLLYSQVFNGETDRIPLIISPPCGTMPAREDLARDTERAVVRAAEALAPKADARTDWIPTVNISWYQCILVPSVFGATPVFQEGSEPIVKPVFHDLPEAVEMGIPPLEGVVVDQMLATLDTAVRVLPEGFALSFPPTASPFDLAQLLLPADEFLSGLLTNPEAAMEFMTHLAQLCAQAFDLTMSRLAGTRSYGVTNRGLYYPGLRLACDAIVNFSPDLIRDMALPILTQFGERFGQLCIHYCSKPAPSAHVLAALCACRCVGAVDTWQGPDAFIGDRAPGRMQSCVGLIFDVDLTTGDKMDAFLDWEPVREVPRRNGRPLVLHTSAASVEDAKRIYEVWQTKRVLADLRPVAVPTD